MTGPIADEFLPWKLFFLVAKLFNLQKNLEASSGIEPEYKDLQSSA